ncbi:uncharacterized protein LOC144138109 isoform X8 [Haemaphysalis longicornis]
MALSRPCSGIVQTLHKICYKGINVQCTLWAGLPSTSLASVSRHHVQLGCLALWHCPDPAQDLLQDTHRSRQLPPDGFPAYLRRTNAVPRPKQLCEWVPQLAPSPDRSALHRTAARCLDLRSSLAIPVKANFTITGYKRVPPVFAALWARQLCESTVY